MVFLSVVAAEPASLVVEVVGARNDAGIVACQIFTSANGFPETDALAVANAVAKIGGGKASCVFPNPPGVPFAVAVIHDEDADLHLDRSWTGLPVEGYAFTNNALGWLGTPPSYEQALVSPGSTSFTLKLVY